MKKKMLAITAAITLMASMSGCNRAIVDTKWKFNKAYINTGSEVIEVDVKTWKDYEDGEQLTIVGKDGKTYLCSSFNCVLVEE